MTDRQDLKLAAAEFRRVREARERPRPLSECPMEAIEALVAFDSRDWSIDRRDAWLYGIVMGWDEAMGEVQAMHGWSDERVATLRRLHAQFKAMRGNS